MQVSTMPKVSIVLPALNVGKYIRQCIESVINQTLKDIEVICVDAGSTDGTLEILQEYVQKDSRVSLINSEKKSYGYQMNLGFAAARGEYLGIVETDDYADPEMFEKLYECAVKNDLDVVKSGFYYYYSKNEERNVPNPIVSRAMANHTFCPMTYFDSKREMVEFFNIKPTIWSSVYKASFIRENGILFNETPGASYQDCSFNFKVWTCAKRVQLIEDCFLHYRQDNEGSSVNSPGKVYCICDEYDEIERFLNEHPVEQGKLLPLMVRLKFDSYTWNYMRLSKDLQKEFIRRFSEDFYRHEYEGLLQKGYFEWYKWAAVWDIIKDPMGYHTKMVMSNYGKNVPVSNAAALVKRVPSRHNTQLEQIKPKLLRKVVAASMLLNEHGAAYAWNYTKNKIRRRIAK